MPKSPPDLDPAAEPAEHGEKTQAHAREPKTGCGLGVDDGLVFDEDARIVPVTPAAMTGEPEPPGIVEERVAADRSAYPSSAEPLHSLALASCGAAEVATSAERAPTRAKVIRMTAALPRTASRVTNRRA